MDGAAFDPSVVDRIVAEAGVTPDRVIPILQALQGEYRHLPEEALRRVCEITEITPAGLVGVATFYDHFRFRPMGRNVLRVCHGTACHVKGAVSLQNAIEDNLGIPAGEDTDPDGRTTVQKVACLGCCTLAPVVQSEHRTFGMLTPAGVPDLLRDIERAAAEAKDVPGEVGLAVGNGHGEIRVGLGSCCVVKGSLDLLHGLRAAVAAAGLLTPVRRVGCVGACHRTPIVEVLAPGREPRLYAEVTPDDAARIVRDSFRPRGFVRRVKAVTSRWIAPLVGDDVDASGRAFRTDVRDPQVTEFLGKQVHIATEHFGVLDPLDLDQAIELGAFRSLQRVLDGDGPSAVIAEVERSGLRGRGGGGFPTARKWRLARNAVGDGKTLIVNGDEGDPGAFMDRMILESYPYRVLEGMTIAAFAIGAHEGIVYLREEYPLAVERVGIAIESAWARGLLGCDVGGSGFAFDVRIVKGAGAFVCGEETALIASVEGRRGMPVLRPPFPVERGLNGRPTVVNNVETIAALPWIFNHGARAYAALGTEKSPGTKVFSLAGKVARGGLIEVPMGITIREIVEEIGGGVPEGRFKAVQVGGPSGGCIPASLADTPIDYEALIETGAMMGSGGLVVLDDHDCMVDMARYFLRFTQNESCGKCTFCRVGTRQMLDILDRVCRGEGKARDLDDLEALARTTRDASICGLGATAPNPVLTTLCYFREEYEAHLAGTCPAGRCLDLIHYRVTDACTGCTICVQRCPVDAIPFTPYVKHAIDDDLCTRCDVCRGACPEHAIEVG
jgi:NADH-quinone oxidoreductase subunit F